MYTWAGCVFRAGKQKTVLTNGLYECRVHGKRGTDMSQPISTTGSRTHFNEHETFPQTARDIHIQYIYIYSIYI